jgi:hypothetical protein
MSDYYVEIVRDKDNKVMKRMGPMPSHKADRVERGASINLDHANYHVRTVFAASVEDEREGETA